MTSGHVRKRSQEATIDMWVIIIEVGYGHAHLLIAETLASLPTLDFGR